MLAIFGVSRCLQAPHMSQLASQGKWLFQRLTEVKEAFVMATIYELATMSSDAYDGTNSPTQNIGLGSKLLSNLTNWKVLMTSALRTHPRLLSPCAFGRRP